MGGVLEGLLLVDVSTTPTGAHVSSLFADFGADVVCIEPPGGSALRALPAWPFWGRGKQSIVLDLADRADVDTARALAERADVLVETWRPGVAERFGLAYEQLVAANPRLVHTSVTAFGRDNRWSHLKGYEPVVFAKIGALGAFSSLSDRPGPSFVATPYCSFTASQLALHGTLAALYERERSGVGQKVDTTLVQGMLAHDTWNWLVKTVVARYPEAFTSAPPTEQDMLVPHSALFFRLMVGLTADGRWLQFSQTTDRLWAAFMRTVGLDWMLDDPEWKDAPGDPDPQVRIAFWERALAGVREKTLDEWMKVFDEEPDVWAEIFRHGTELLHHPQVVFDRRVATIVDPELGPVLQPGPLVHLDTTPAQLQTSAPRLDEHRAAIRRRAAERASAGTIERAPNDPPLAGVTVLELGSFYAAPFGATVLADLGARVIKVEQLDGDPIRHIMPFPEVGGVKVLQGKESVAVDASTPSGREIVLELVRRADVVLQSFRAGVAERHSYTADDLLAVNPDLVYLAAPGYGTGGPCGAKPAFAPTIGAGSGLAYRNVGGVANVAQGADLTLDEVKHSSMRLNTAAMGVAHADGFAAVGVGTAMLVGLLAKQRGAPGQAMFTSMLTTMAHALGEDMLEYEGKPPLATPDVDLYGLSARYRLYESADGWVFLAAPADDEWEALATQLGLPDELRADDDALTERLSEVFRTRVASEWEAELTAVDVACVEVAKGPVEDLVMLGGGMGRELGIVTEQSHPVIGDYLRLTPTVTLSRSAGVAGPAPLCGAQTDTVLAEIGYADRIDELRTAGIIGSPVGETSGDS